MTQVEQQVQPESEDVFGAPPPPEITDVHGAGLFLPEPEPRDVQVTIISVDDHVLEPPHAFEGRFPSHLQDRAPKVIELGNGHQAWEFDGTRRYEWGDSVVAGRQKELVLKVPFRYEFLRPGAFEPAARVLDMDLNGVWASLNFPSFVSGFCGRIFSLCSDQELGIAATRAWNDWYHEEWYEPYPERFIPMSVTYLADPEAGAAEIYRNSARGVRAVSLPERPHRLGLPSIFTEHWDPILRACAETGTVVNLHIGSSGVHDAPPGIPDEEALGLTLTLFGQLSLHACAEWLFSPYPRRYPDLKIAMSEGGIGWCAMLIDRLENMVDRSPISTLMGWRGERPADVLRRNFWFCTLDDPSTIDTREVIGVENIMLEVDYPHGDGTWPDTQELIASKWAHLPDDELRAIACENAARLYQHPLPPVVLPL